MRMKKLAAVLLLTILTLSCGREMPGETSVAVPFGMAQASPESVFFPSADGENYLEISRSKIDAEPCYIKVFDEKAGAQTECTATSHTLLYRFTWKIGTLHILKFRPSDLGHGKMNVLKSGPAEICASCQDFFSVVRFSAEIVNFEFDGSEAMISFRDDSGSVVAVAGLSYSALAEAKTNLTAESSDNIFDLESTVTDAVMSWESAYKVTTGGGSDTSKTALEAGLRRSAMMVSVFSDRRHTYRNRQGVITRARFDNVYSKPVDWKEVRAWAPLAVLLYPTVLTDFCLSCCDMYGTEGEYMPEEAYPIVSDAYARGMMGSLNAQYWEMVKESLGEVPPAPDMSGSDSYKTLALMGLVPDSSPGTGYTFTAPAFRKISIRLGTGKVLTISSNGKASNAPKTVLLNGEIVADGHISLESILGGGDIVLKF